MATKTICEFPPSERIVSMITFRDTIILATECRVYRLVNADADNVTLEPLEVEREDR